MSKYTATFQTADFGRRIEMSLYDSERRSFVVPNFGLSEEGRLFMAGSPKEFADFISAIVSAWNEHLMKEAGRAENIHGQYGEAFLEGFHQGRGDEPPSRGAPDEHAQGREPDDQVRRLGPS